MRACPEHEEQLSLLAADALEPAEDKRVRAHLESCAGCHHEVNAQRELLGLAALPPLTPREEAVHEALPRTTLGVWRRKQVRDASRMRTTGGLLAVAAAVLLVLGPFARQALRVPEPAPASVGDDASDTLSLEEWALADPLEAALDEGDALADDVEDGADDWDVEPEDFLSPPTLGDTP
jgi:anti-sigma factor RsiW